MGNVAAVSSTMHTMFCLRLFLFCFCLFLVSVGGFGELVSILQDRLGVITFLGKIQFCFAFSSLGTECLLVFDGGGDRG